MDEVTFRHTRVTRRDILRAITEFHAQYPSTNDYRNWLDKRNYKYVLWHEGAKYPPKHILSMATGIPSSGFGGGVNETNRVLGNLGFVVTTK